MSPLPLADVIQQVEECCRALKARGALSWEWDGRFSAALAVTQDPQHTEVLALLDELLPASFDHSNISQAPGRIAALSADLGGLRPGQKMLTLAPAGEPLLFALWWPWGGGDRFSLRVGCHAAAEAAHTRDPAELLKECFEL